MIKNSHLFGVAVMILALMSAGAAWSGSPGGTATGSIVVQIASASTKKEWINEAVKSFNDSSRSNRDFQIDGNPIRVEIIQEETEPGVLDHYRSGTMVTDILSGKIKPVAASPGEATWLRKLNSDWKATHDDKGIFTDNPTTLLQTPVIVAMWQSRAMALACWPVASAQCTWQRLSDLAADPNGWGAFGQPEWGNFKFGYGYVGESNSGTFATLMFCMAGLGKTKDLRLEDIDAANGCGQTLARVDKAKVHSGIKSSWLLGWMKEKGQTYLDAVATNEQDVIEFNVENGSILPEPLVVVYPQDGTVVRTDPYVVLDQAPWVTGEQVRAARLFQGYLLTEGQQKKLLKWGLRPRQPGGNLGSPIEPRYGANPEAKFVAVEVPDVPVFDRLTEVWHERKKHAVIALVVDRSARMGGDKLQSTKEGIISFIDSMDPQDYLIWMPFDDALRPGVRGSVADIGPRLIEIVKNETETGGGTALYDAIYQAYTDLETQKKDLGESVKYGIVLVSDGRDTKSKLGFTLLRNKLSGSESDPTGIQIHTIGVGKDARKDILTIIATLAHGKYWDAADPRRLRSIYTQIAVYY
jgi:Ca-activated chloride channel family protein